MVESWKDQLFLRTISGIPDQQPQTRLAKSQWSKAWWTFSRTFPQMGHSGLEEMPREQTLSLVGSPLTQACQTNILTLAGSLKRHRFFQRGLNGSPLELSASAFDSTRQWPNGTHFLQWTHPVCFPSRLVYHPEDYGWGEFLELHRLQRGRRWIESFQISTLLYPCQWEKTPLES